MSRSTFYANVRYVLECTRNVHILHWVQHLFISIRFEEVAAVFIQVLFIDFDQYWISIIILLSKTLYQFYQEARIKQSRTPLVPQLSCSWTQLPRLAFITVIIIWQRNKNRSLDAPTIINWCRFNYFYNKF